MTGRHDGLRMQVTVGYRFVDLGLCGDLDLATADHLDRMLLRVERLDARLLVHLRDVEFIDSAGLEPLMDTARRRGAHTVAGVRLCDTSRPVRRLLHLVGSTDTTLNPRAWDEFCKQAPPMPTPMPMPSPMPSPMPHSASSTAPSSASALASVVAGAPRSAWSRSLSAVERRLALLAGERWAS